METPTRWLSQQSGHDIQPGNQVCYLCGESCAEGHLVSTSIAETFNSHSLAQCRSSASLCAACAWYLDSKAGHPDFRKMSLVVMRSSWRNWQRADMRADIERWLAHGLEEDAYLVVSLTKKKHILLQSPLNAGGGPSGLAVQVEENRAYFGPAEWQAVAQPFTRLLSLGHQKGEILSGNLYAGTLRKHGQLEETLRLSERLSPWRNSPLIELYSYVTLLEEKGTEDFDGIGRDQPGTGDGAPDGSRASADGRVEKRRSRIQEPLPRRNLAPIRGTHRHSRTDDGNPASASQPNLWDV